MILWDLPLGIKLAGLVVGKGTHVITLHLLKAAPKMTRLDEAGLKKRAATRGDGVVEVKPGDAVLRLTDGWAVEKFVELKKSDEKKKEKSEKVAPVKKPAAAKKTPAKAPAKGKATASKAKKAPAVKKPVGKK